MKLSLESTRSPHHDLRAPGACVPRARNLLALLVLTLAAACADDYTVTVFNDSQIDFVPYPVVTTPAPHREADPANTLGPGDQTQVDPGGFNLLYYHAASQRSIDIQFAFDQDPAQILARLTKHEVPPDQTPTSPAEQPTLLEEKVFEPAKFNLLLKLGRLAGGDFPVTLEES